jgi:hypothetical protein
MRRNLEKVRFQVLTVASMKMTVFWNVALCSLVEVYRCFRGACCLHHQAYCPSTRLHGTTSQKIVILNLEKLGEIHMKRLQIVFRQIRGSHHGLRQDRESDQECIFTNSVQCYNE